MPRKAQKKEPEVPETVGEGDGAVTVVVVKAFTHQRRLIVEATLNGERMAFNLPEAQFTSKDALLKELKAKYLQVKHNTANSKRKNIESLLGEVKV